MDISKLRYLRILGAPGSLGFIKSEYSLLGLLSLFGLFGYAGMHATVFMNRNVVWYLGRTFTCREKLSRFI